MAWASLELGLLLDREGVLEKESSEQNCVVKGRMGVTQRKSVTYKRNSASKGPGACYGLLGACYMSDTTKCFTCFTT